MQGITRKLVSGSLWSLVGTFLSQTIALCASVLLARALGQDGFGALSVARITVTMVSSFLGVGLGIAAAKHVAEFKETQPDRAGAILGLLIGIAVALSTAGALVLVATSPLLADTVLNASYLQSALAASGLLLIGNVVGGVQAGALAGITAFRAFAWMSISEALLSLALGLVGALLMNVTGAILGLACASIVSATIRHYLLVVLLKRKGISITLRHWRADFRLLKVVALPSMLIAAVVQPFEWLGRVLIARGPDGFGQVAIFSAAQSLALITQIGPSQIANASLPLLTQTYASGAFQTFRRTVIRSTAFVLLCGILVAGVVAAGSKPLMGLYGHSFADRNDVLIVLAATYSIAVVTMQIGSALTAANRNWAQLLQKALWGATMIVAAYFLSNEGALGLAYAYAIGNGVFIVTQLIVITHLLNRISQEQSARRGLTKESFP
jgi:O-antigen/teichoic acid export membrane protein